MTNKKLTIAEFLKLKNKKLEIPKIETKTRYEKFCENLIKQKKILAKKQAKKSINNQ